MVSFKAILQKFNAKGEKSGWTYILIPAHVSEAISPGTRKSYRVKGTIDKLKISSAALLPMGNGEFILAVNADMRKALAKQKGAEVMVKLSLDKSPQKLSPLLLSCLEDAPEARRFFDSLVFSHQMYFSRWIESAKTDATRTRRVAMSINAFDKHWGFPEMIRASRKL